jgi:gamma-carbonic anhydrase
MPIYSFGGVWPTIAASAFIAPGAMIIGDVTIEDDASIWYNVVIRGDVSPITIGRGTNVQDNSTLHAEHDSPVKIGAGCTIGHNAIVHGATLEDGVLIGMHATVLSYAQIGAGSIIGAGALVPERGSIPAGVLAMGIPARVLRPLTQQEQQRIQLGEFAYRQLANSHRDAIAREGSR